MGIDSDPLARYGGFEDCEHYYGVRRKLNAQSRPVLWVPSYDCLAVIYGRDRQA